MLPRTLIIRTAGTNCDRELAHAFDLAGASTRTVHLNALLAEPDLIDEFYCVGFPGGFSYGDDIAAGRIFANRLRHRLLEPLRRAVDRGVPMIGICNGFQVLIKMGLLPDPHEGHQVATLGTNSSGRFVDRWVGLEVPPRTCCIWTRGLEALELPVAHGEGRFVVAENGLLRRLQSKGQVAVAYATGENPNGSMGGVAGICDPQGLVLGLMPHPERFTHPTHHPQWTRLGDGFLRSAPAGLRFFRNAVDHVRSN